MVKAQPKQEKWIEIGPSILKTKYALKYKLYYDKEDDKEEEDSDENTEPEKKNRKRKRNIPMDPDHRILLKSAKPLLQSRNAAVVMATAQLYYHCAPRAEVR